MKEKLAEFSIRGDIKAVAHKLVHAANEGKFEDKKVSLETLQTVSQNLHVKSAHGKQYKSPLKQFYEALLTLDWPRLATFVAQNLGGPEINTIYQWRQKIGCP